MPTWLGSAGRWLLAYLACCLVATIGANIVVFATAGRETLNPDMASINTFGIPLALVIANILALHIMLGLLAGLFTQATALLLIRKRVSLRYLYVTLLNLFSATLAFLVFFPSAKEVVRTSGLDLEIQIDATLSLMLVGFYVAHVVILVVARRLVRRHASIVAPTGAREGA